MVIFITFYWLSLFFHRHQWFVWQYLSHRH